MSIVVHVTSTEKVLRGAVRLSAARCPLGGLGSLSSDRAGASAFMTDDFPLYNT